MSRPCIVVAGLGRCGTTMVMQMLSAGGIPTIGARPAFEDDRTSRAVFDPAWFAGLSECAVKILNAHDLPIRDMPNHIVIWLSREPREQAKSMAKFLTHFCGATGLNRQSRRALEQSIGADTPKARARIGVPGGTDCLSLLFEQIIDHRHRAAAQISAFLKAWGYDAPGHLMAPQVIQRNPSCLPGFLEMSL